MGSKKKNLTVALGAAAALTLAASPAFSASSNPFQMRPLSSGYLAKAETKPAESKPAETKPADAHCGAAKAKDGSCGADKKKDGHCGADKKAKDGKCGEGTCGSNKK